MAQKINREHIESFGNLELLAKQVVEGFITGLHKSPFHGFSVEFAEHRLYNTGESTRHIDWKLFARTEKHFVKRYEEETNLRCQIVIDHSSSMYYPEDDAERNTLNKIEFSAYAAASLIELLKKQRDAIGLSIFSDKIEEHTPSKLSASHLQLIYNLLDSLILEKNELQPTSAVAALHEIAERIHKRSLVLVFSDMMDSRESLNELFLALQHLKHNKHEVVLFHVVDRAKEMDFEFENRPYSFVDMETGEQVKLHPNAVKKEYKKQAEAFDKELKMKAGQFAIDYVEADINQNFHQVLMAYLIKRNRMTK